MSKIPFHSRAWTAAAEEYGRARAQRYGRLANLGVFLGGFAIAVLALATVGMVAVHYGW